MYFICKTNFTDSFLSFMEEEYNKDNIYDINFYPYSIENLQAFNNENTI